MMHDTADRTYLLTWLLHLEQRLRESEQRCALWRRAYHKQQRRLWNARYWCRRHGPR